MHQTYPGLHRNVQPDFEALLANLRREGTPRRVHHMELFHDGEIEQAIVRRFGLDEGVIAADPHYAKRLHIKVRRFLGFDYVSCGLVDMNWTYHWGNVADPAGRAGGRNYMDEHAGPITNRRQFEAYPWPDPHAPSATRDLEWYSANLPDDMCLISHTGHFCENLCWLMGYETLCIALYEQRDLVEAIYRKVLDFHTAEVARLLQFPRVRAIWGSDDMGFKTGLMFGPQDMRRFVLAGHKALAAQAHAAGRLYLLHSCGNLSQIMAELVHDVRIDAKHSFEDTIEDCRDAKRTWGRQAAMIGGIDMDFLCRQDEPAIRARVRDTLKACLPGGGYALGTGNTVANYIPLDNYLAMVDEGRLYA